MVTQRQIADDLGISQATVSNILATLGAQTPTTLEDARRAILHHYQQAAAGRGAGGDYHAQRARSERYKADLLEISVQEKARALVPVALVEKEWMAILVAARNELLQIPDKIAHEIQAGTKPADIPALVDKHIRDALNLLANREPEV